MRNLFQSTFKNYYTLVGTFGILCALIEGPVRNSSILSYIVGAADDNNRGLGICISKPSFFIVVQGTRYTGLNPFNSVLCISSILR